MLHKGCQGEVITHLSQINAMQPEPNNPQSGNIDAADAAVKRSAAPPATTGKLTETANKTIHD